MLLKRKLSKHDSFDVFLTKQ